MNPDLSNTLIGAGATLIAALIPIFITQQKLKKQRQRVAAFEKTIQKTNDGVGEFAAYTLKKQQREIIIDKDGNAQVTRSYIGIRPKQSMRNLKIPFRFYANNDDVKLEAPTVKETRDSVLSVGIEGKDLVNSEKDYREYKGHFVIYGNCDENTGNIGFTSTQKSLNAFLMTKEKVVKKYRNADWKQEYYSSRISVPTDELIISIVFPDNFAIMAAKPVPIAFLRGTYINVDKETNRIKKSFEFNNLKVTLVVSSPVPWIEYVISWMPPTAIN